MCEGITLIEFIDPKTFHIFGRDINGKRTHVIDKSFYPYFYIDEKIEIPSNVKKWLKMEEYGFESIFGDKVKKLIFNFMEVKGDFREMRESFEKTYEDDVVFTTRYLIDNKQLKFTDNYRINTLDIETSMRFGIKDKRNTIKAITFHDSYLDKYSTYCIWPEKAGEQIEMDNNWNLFWVESEYVLLTKIVNYIEFVESDIITGWNTQTFDLPYIYWRCKENGVDMKRMSPINSVYLKENPKENYLRDAGKIYGELRIKGLQCLDSMAVLKKVTAESLHSYALDFVCKFYLNKGKLEYEGNLDELYEKDKLQYCKYNKNDVELVVELNKKIGIINFFTAFQKYSPVNLTDMFYISRPIDNLILRTYHNQVVFPSKRKNIKEKYVGAFVKDPFCGVKKNVVVFDVKAMYTNLQLSLNISPDTKSKDGDIEIHGVRFKSSPEGLIPRILKDLQVERDRLKVELKKYDTKSSEYKSLDDAQKSVKTLMNSFYGGYGSPYTRYYDKEIAQSITLAGQDSGNEISKIVREMGHNDLYGDTDSRMVELVGLKEGDDIIKIGEDMKNHINTELERRMEEKTGRKCSINVEFEKAYTSFMMLGKKKKYCGMLIMKDGKKYREPTYFEMGFTGRKRDSSPITKRLEKECLMCLLNGGNKDDIIKLSRDAYRNIKKENIGDLAIKYKLSKNLDDYKNKNAQHVRAIRTSQKYWNYYCEIGDTISFVYVKKYNGYTINDVMAVDKQCNLDLFEVDNEKTSDRHITKTLSHIFEAFKWDLQDIDTEQKKLEMWFA